jgi:hypothetical protein
MMIVFARQQASRYLCIRMHQELEASEEEDGAMGPGSDGDEDGGALQAPGLKQRRKGSVRPDRDPIYDTEAMHEKIEDFGWSDVVPWEETLALTGEDPSQVENVDDDLARELAFYNQVCTSWACLLMPACTAIAYAISSQPSIDHNHVFKWCW